MRPFVTLVSGMAGWGDVNRPALIILIWRRSACQSPDTPARASTSLDERAYLSNDVGFHQQWGVPLIGNFERRDVRPSGPHRIDGLDGEDIRIGAPNDHQWNRGQRIEFLPEGWQRMLHVDALQHAGEIRIV